MDIDKPLEEIIAASKPKGQRGGRPARGVARGGAQNGTRDRYASNVPRNVPRAAPVKPTSDAFKIIISNLPQDVTEPAVRVSNDKDSAKVRISCSRPSVPSEVSK
jgi:THO complex subunit 4